jgi:hypothetical protein
LEESSQRGGRHTALTSAAGVAQRGMAIGRVRLAASGPVARTATTKRVSGKRRRGSGGRGGADLTDIAAISEALREDWRCGANLFTARSVQSSIA